MAQRRAHNRAGRSRDFLLALGAIVLMALGLRLAVCLQLCAQPFVEHPAVGTDMETYRRLALQIAQGDLPTHFYYQPFYYAVFLPAIYRIAGSGPWGPALAQVALSTAAVWLTGLAAARLFGRRAGLAAAILLALARFQMFYVPFLLLEVLQTFWISLILYLGIRVWETRSGLRVVLLGLVTGAAVLTRGNAILLVPGLLALVAWRWRTQPLRAAGAALLILSLAYAPQLPFALRNLHHLGRWAGPSTAQDAVLALGNSPEAPPGGLEYPATYSDWMERAGRSGPERVPVSREIMAWIRRAPLPFIELKARMLLLYWYRLEIPNNINIVNEGRHSTVLGWPVLLPFGLIGVLAVFGLLTGLRWRSPRRLLLGYAVGAHCAGTILFYVLARFRLSVVPLLCVLGGAGLAWGWARVRALRAGRPKARERALAGLLAAALALFVVLAGFSWYQSVLEPAVTRWLRPHGVQVQTPRRTLVYDHGPYSLGGIRAVPVPAAGLLVRKRFALDNLDLPPQAPTLRVPVLLEKGTRFEAAVVVGETHVDTSAMQVDEDRGCQRLSFRLAGLPSPRAAAEVTLRIRPVSGGVGLLIDALRWYGRSEFLVEGQDWPLGAEAAFELEWLREPDAKADGPATR